MKKRLDVILTERKCFDTREKAQRAIMAGNVFINNSNFLKAGNKYDEDVTLVVRDFEEKYVSRGGYKLEKALSLFDISLENKDCMDIGASTGGFTDCMLQKGAKKVFSVDVGYGQLSWKIRTNPKVSVFERTNFRYFNPSPRIIIDFASIDVSFISLGLIFNNLVNFVKENSEVVCLIKPQFEAGREKVGKNGVVKDRKVHVEVIEKVIALAQYYGFGVRNLTYSPIKGPEGNIEFLMYAIYSQDTKVIDVSELVSNSHKELYNEEYFCSH